MDSYKITIEFELASYDDFSLEEIIKDIELRISPDIRLVARNNNATLKGPTIRCWFNGRGE